MTLAEKCRRLAGEFPARGNPQASLAAVVARGRKSRSLPETLRRDEFLVPGCVSKLWLVSRLDGDRCCFECDSDSAVVKGVATLLCDYYSGQPADEILADTAEPLSALGIGGLLPPNRRNGISRLVERIRQFARENVRSRLPDGSRNPSLS